VKAKDLAERSVEDLNSLKASLVKDLFSYRMKNFTDQLEDNSLSGRRVAISRASKPFCAPARRARERSRERR
jgi:hypothetical protein